MCPPVSLLLSFRLTSVGREVSRGGASGRGPIELLPCLLTGFAEGTATMIADKSNGPGLLRVSCLLAPSTDQLALHACH